jgi:rhodanese-related sulfurtransferase
MATQGAEVPSSRNDGVQSISPELLLRWLATGRRILVIDVREPAEVSAPHSSLPGAVHIPVHQLFVRRHELPLGKVDTVVTVSNEGVRSRAAAFTLSLLGFADVRSLEGGLAAWAKRRMPLA